MPIPPRSLEAPNGKPFGPYLILEELGAGASGAVFRAWHRGLQRDCALKILHSRVSSALVKERFDKEGRSSARIGKHPNIVQVFDAGVVDDVPYLAMELVAGIPLDRRIAEAGRLSEVEALELGRKIALALDHAHGRGIIHRDLKPGNVIIDEEGEPQILDFGLAKDLSDDVDFSHAGTIIGTPAYLPPEQADPSFGEADQRSDIYSLGVTLFTALTGAFPFRASTVFDTIVKVLTLEPPNLTERGVSEDVQAIIHRSMEKRPRDRYQTALDLADDLSRVLKGEPPKARSMGRVSKGARWVKRHPVLSGSVLGATILVLFLTSWFVYQRNEADALWSGLSRQIAKATADETRNLLEPALPILEEMSMLARYDLLPVDDLEQLSKHLVVRFKPRVALDWISYGRSDGEFVGVKRTLNGRKLVINRSSATQRWVTEHEVDDAFDLTQIRRDADTYDPRTRPFYVLAVERSAPAWTKPYKYWGSDDGVGITATLADRRADGVVRGVFTVDFRLHGLSRFLARLDLGEGGQAFLLRSRPANDAQLSPLVLAGPRLEHSSETPELVADAMRRVTVSLDALEPGSPTVVPFSSGGVSYLGALEAFEVQGGIRWVTLVAVPVGTLGLSTMPLLITATMGAVLVVVSILLMLVGSWRRRRLARERARRGGEAFGVLSEGPDRDEAPPRDASPQLSASEETAEFQRDERL